MGRPLRILNTSDLAEMSDAEIKGKIVPLILGHFANDSSPYLRGNIHSHSGTVSTDNIGNFSNTIRTNNPGYHESGQTGTNDASHTTTTNYSFSQYDAFHSSSYQEPVGWEGSGIIQEMDYNRLKTDILRCCAEEWIKTGENTGIGSYYLGQSSPASALGGTWTAASSLTNFGGGTGTIINDFTDTFKLNSSGNLQTSTYKLWRKTSYSHENTNPYIPCTTATVNSVTGNIRQMSDTEIQNLSFQFRDFLLVDNGTIGSTTVGTIGTYIIKTGSAPSTGTWVYMGTFLDKIARIVEQQYSQQYTGYSDNTMYTQQYDGNYTRFFSGQFRTFYGHFGGARYSPYYTGYSNNTMYTQQFDGNFTRNFSAQYTGNFAGDTIQAANNNSGTESPINANSYILYRRIG